jgi:hypothetical protein
MDPMLLMDSCSYHLSKIIMFLNTAFSTQIYRVCHGPHHLGICTHRSSSTFTSKTSFDVLLLTAPPTYFCRSNRADSPGRICRSAGGTFPRAIGGDWGLTTPRETEGSFSFQVGRGCACVSVPRAPRRGRPSNRARRGRVPHRAPAAPAASSPRDPPPASHHTRRR